MISISSAEGGGGRGRGISDRIVAGGRMKGKKGCHALAILGKKDCALFGDGGGKKGKESGILIVVSRTYEKGGKGGALWGA